MIPPMHHHTSEITFMQHQAPATHLFHHSNQAPQTMCKGEILSLKQRRLSLPLKKRPYCPLSPPSISKVCVTRGPKTFIKAKASRPQPPCLSHKTSKHQQKKSVRFAKVQKTRILKKLDLTDEDRHNMWYQPRDYMEIDQDSLKNLQALQRVDGDLVRLNHDEYCVRGLEMKTSPHINRLRRLRASICVRAVLDTQTYMMMGNDKHKDMGESLAAVSRRYTTTAQVRARELGIIDSIEAAQR